MKKFVSIILLSGILTTSSVIMPETMAGIAANAADVDSYSYKITPLLAPFNEYFFVETDNPDPKSFRFVDKSSVYNENSTIVFDWDDWDEKLNLYADVKFDDTATARVNGGYIFVSNTTDGGEIQLQKRVPGRYSWDDTWEDKNVKLTLPKLKDDVDYLIDTYATKSDFFENMDAVQNGFDSICLYSGSYIRGNVVKTSDYWEVVTAGHSDQSFYIYSPYDRKDTIPLFSSRIYPYRYDSLGFPSVMGAVSKRLDSSSSYKWNSTYHWLIDVTYNDKTKSYGGAGYIEGQGITKDKIKKYYTFGKNGTKIDLKETFDLQKEYSEIEMDDDIPREGAVTWKNLCEKVGSGAWCRINRSMKSYAYFFRESDFDSYSESEWGVGYNLYYGGDLGYAQDSWVDGRYVNSGKIFEKGVKFEDHPTSSIILKKVKVPIFDYKTDYEYDYENQKYNIKYILTSDVTEKEKTLKFYYNKELNKWFASYHMKHGSYDVNVNYDWLKKYTDSNLIDKKYLDQIELTQDEVKALRVDRNTSIVPSDGYIYDGKSEPGTKFHYPALENNSTVSAGTIYLGGSVKMTASAKGGASSSYTYTYRCRKSGTTTWKYLASNTTEKTCSFKPGSEGTYTLQVIVKDPTDTVTTKGFTLKVNAAPLKNNSTINASSVEAGKAVTLTAKASGGTAPYTYTYRCRKSGTETWKYLAANSATASFKYKPNTAGSYDIQVLVKDAKNKVVAKEFKLNVKAALVNNSIINAATVKAGSEVKITAKAAGGTAPYTYTYRCRKSGTETWKYLATNVKTTTLSYKPNSSGNYDIQILVKDAKGKVVNKGFTLKVTEAALSNVSTISATSVKNGSAVTLTAKAAGGKAPYTYTYRCKKTDTSTWKYLAANTNTASLSYKPSSAGTYDIQVIVKDANGKVVTKAFKLTVKA